MIKQTHKPIQLTLRRKGLRSQGVFITLNK